MQKLILLLIICSSLVSCSTQTDAEINAEAGIRKARVWDIKRHCMNTMHIDTLLQPGDTIFLRDDNPRAPMHGGFAYGVVR